jgi:putative proteasome-type protease
MKVDEGMIFASDSRTNAGLDNIAKFCKMTVFERAGDRVMVLLSSGNLAGTQAIISLLAQRGDDPDNRHSLWKARTMFDAVNLVSDAMRDIERRDGASLEASDLTFNASFILGGQIRGTEPRLFQIYPEGNFIECSEDTPFFQIGETKYGKPIIVRAYDRAMSFAETAKLLMVSFDSTLKSNLSVGLPLDLMFYQKDSMRIGFRKRIGIDDPYYRTVSDGWSNALKTAFKSLPDFPEA